MTANIPASERPDPYRVASESGYADDSAYVLNRADTFAVIDHRGDLGGGAQGLYHLDTRHLSTFAMRLNGAVPVLLTSTVTDDNLALVVDAANRDLPGIPKNTLHLRKRIALRPGACEIRFELRNHDTGTHEVEFALHVDADFRDIFEVRGLPRTRQAPARTLSAASDGFVFGYAGLDGVARRTHVAFSPPPQATAPGGVALFRWRLEPGAAAELDVVIAIERAAADGHRAVARDWRACLPQIETNHGPLNCWLARSAADLASLIADTPHGPYPHAGVPWYNTAFGRDGIITALQTGWALPQLSAGVLRFLAATQATRREPARDAEPGKIVHETRAGEMARLGEVPFERYYGAVDGTPLFVMLAGSYLRRTDDLGLVRELWPAIEAALGWIRDAGDVDGDGFVEYAGHVRDGLANQGWKDSVDSVSHADGALALPPIALCEVQGYVCAAWSEAAYMLRRLGDGARAARLREDARELKRRFNAVFWQPRRGIYALALDAAKRPCAVRSSNAGHCLWTGIAHRRKAERLRRSLFDPSMFGGWGVRTLGAGEARHNPMSYHNGSIWPHDNAIIAAGLARYGFMDAAEQLFASLLDAATLLPLHRMPELYCGFDRVAGNAPVPYPVACAPQAWAVGTVYQLLAALLGLDLDARRRTLAFHSPRLPEGVDWLRIRRWALPGGECELEFRRHERDIALNVARKPLRWTILTTR